MFLKAQNLITINKVRLTEQQDQSSQSEQIFHQYQKEQESKYQDKD